MDASKEQQQPAAPRLKKIAIVSSFATVFLIFSSIYTFAAFKLHDQSVVNFIVLRPQPPNRFYGLDQIPGIKRQTLYITCRDGSKLHCWLFRVPGSDKIVIVNHGNAGNISNRIYIASALTKAGCSALLYDYRGYGSSSGKPTIDGILQDGLTVYDYVHGELRYPSNKILLFGESIGSGVTTNLAANRSCAGVILESAIGSLPAVGKSLFPFLYLFPDLVFAQPTLDNVAAVKSIHVPILFMHGKRDTVVPYQHSQQMFANANEPKQLVLLSDCGHNDMGVQNTRQFHDVINQFIQSVK